MLMRACRKSLNFASHCITLSLLDKCPFSRKTKTKMNINGLKTKFNHNDFTLIELFFFYQTRTVLAMCRFIHP